MMFKTIHIIALALLVAIAVNGAVIKRSPGDGANIGGNPTYSGAEFLPKGLSDLGMTFNGIEFETNYGKVAEINSTKYGLLLDYMAEHDMTFPHTAFNLNKQSTSTELPKAHGTFNLDEEFSFFKRFMEKHKASFGMHSDTDAVSQGESMSIAGYVDQCFAKQFCPYSNEAFAVGFSYLAAGDQTCRKRTTYAKGVTVFRSVKVDWASDWNQARCQVLGLEMLRTVYACTQDDRAGGEAFYEDGMRAGFVSLNKA